MKSMNYLIGLLLLGLVAGWLSGLIGIGGGIIMVPALMFLFAFSLRTAEGTSIAALAPPIGILAAYVYKLSHRFASCGRWRPACR